MFRENKVTSGRVLGMAETRSPQEIAAILGIDEDDVFDMLEKAGKPVKTTSQLICNRTNQAWNVRSERGAYILAMIKGLTDWDFKKA
jgi:hypothetical protein